MHGRLRIADAETEAALGKARGLLADAGHRSERNAGLCEAWGIEPWISAGRQGHSRPLATVSEDRGSPLPDGGGADGLAHEVEGGPEDAFKTQSTVEPVSGTFKDVMGFRRFCRRGAEAVRCERDLARISRNWTRMRALVS